MAPVGVSFGQPTTLTPFKSSPTSINLLVSDTENNRILFVPLNSQQIIVPEYASDIQPGWLAVDYTTERVYTVSGNSLIHTHPIIDSGD